MKEENNDVSKFNWRQIFRKKWFFPAVFITVAALLLTVVIWYQSLDNQIPEIADEGPEVTDNFVPADQDGDVESVMDPQEVIQMPVADEDQAEIVTKYYDYNADEEDQENALVFHDNHYYPSTGIDIVAADGESFDVLASLSGTVSEVKVHPLHGNIVVLSHDHDVMTYYASLEEVLVKEGDDVKQGDLVGNAGNNVIGKENGTHVHFEVRKDDETFNPETYMNQPISKLDPANDDIDDINEDDNDVGEDEEDEDITKDDDVDEDETEDEEDSDSTEED